MFLGTKAKVVGARRSVSETSRREIIAIACLRCLFSQVREVVSHLRFVFFFFFLLFPFVRLSVVSLIRDADTRRQSTYYS